MEFTREDIKKLKDALRYMTQYATYYTDEGFYEELFDSWSSEDFDVDKLVEALSLAPDNSDDINQIVFDGLWSLDDDKIDRIKEVLEADDNELMDLVGWDIYEETTDIATGDYWWDLADNSLKSDGMDSNLICAIEDIRNMYNDELYEINAYGNGFKEVDLWDTFLGYGGLELIKEYIQG